MTNTLRLVLGKRDGQPISILLVNTVGKRYGHILRLMYLLDVKTYSQDKNFMDYNLYYIIDGFEAEYDVVDIHDCYSGNVEEDKYESVPQECLMNSSVDYETMEEYDDVILKNNMLLKRPNPKALVALEYETICFVDDNGTLYNIQQSDFEASVLSRPLDLSEMYIEDIESWLKHFYLGA